MNSLQRARPQAGVDVAPRPTVSAREHLAVGGVLSRPRRSGPRPAHRSPSMRQRRRAARSTSPRRRHPSASTAVGGLLGLLGREPQPDERLDDLTRARRGPPTTGGSRRRRRRPAADLVPQLQHQAFGALACRCRARGSGRSGHRRPAPGAGSSGVVAPPAWPARSSGRPRRPTGAGLNRSRDSASAKPNSVIESSRTIIAVISRASVRRAAASASVAGVVMHLVADARRPR